MSDDRRVGRQKDYLMLEALAFGLAYTAGLCWVSVCILASFRPSDLSAPYWSRIPGLRSDTFGVLSFFAVAIFLACSEFLRLYRKRAGTTTGSRAPRRRLMNVAALALSETGAVLATGLVLYISINAVTHPATMYRQATHLVSWPTEETLRVISLLLCFCSMSTVRFLKDDHGAR